MKLIIDIPDEDYTAVRCEALYYIGHDKLAESVTTAFQTATPYEEISQGEWSDLSTDGRHTGWIVCSVCGQEPPNESNLRTNFCPNCGAKMGKGGAE